MPQLNPEYFISQLFWLAVFFSILFLVLWRISLPRISNVIEKRQHKINENLSIAKELQEKANKIESNINNKLKKAQNETDDQIKKTISILNDETLSQISSLDKELEEKILNSEKDILNMRDKQKKDITEEIKNITKITVAKISGVSLSDSDITDAIQSSKDTLN